MMSADKRSTDRVALSTKVHLEFEKFSGFVSEFSHNISEGGMFIKTQNPLPIGSIVNFEFKLKDSFQLINGTGEVSWLRTVALSEEDPEGMGIRFKDLSDRSRDLINALIYQARNEGKTIFDIDQSHPKTKSSDHNINANSAAQNTFFDESLSIPRAKDATPEFNLQKNQFKTATPNNNVTPLYTPNTKSVLEKQTPVDKKNIKSKSSILDDASIPLNELRFTPAQSSGEPTKTLHQQNTDLNTVETQKPSGLSQVGPTEIDAHLNDTFSFAEDTPKKRNNAWLVLPLLLLFGFISLVYWLATSNDSNNAPLVQLDEAPNGQINNNADLDTSNSQVRSDAVATQESPKQDIVADSSTGRPTLADRAIADITSKTTEEASKQSDTAAAAKAVQTTVESTEKTTKPTVSKSDVAKALQNKAKPSSNSIKVASGTHIVNNIRWSNELNDWVLWVEANKTWNIDNYKHFSIRNGNPRELIVLKNIAKNYKQSSINVSQSDVSQVRVGYHNSKNPPELHLVVDLNDRNVRFKQVVQQGNILKIYFSR